MPNANPKPRPRLQLHLSTCVVLMVVAGELVEANVVPRQVGEEEFDMTRWADKERGWLGTYQKREEAVEVSSAVREWAFPITFGENELPAWELTSSTAFEDGLVELTILAVGAAASDG